MTHQGLIILTQQRLINSTAVQQEINYTQGKLNGRSLNYYQNGNIYAEGNFENNEKEGEWKWYYDTGLLQCSVNYVDNKKEGSQVFLSETGQPTKI